MRKASQMIVVAGAVVLSLLPVSRVWAQAQQEPQLPPDDQCIICHMDLDEMPEDFAAYDVHLQEGLSCAGCHGGDPTSDDDEVAMSPQRGFVGIPTRAELPEFCGKCHSDPDFMRTYQPRIHTDQVEQYRISMHGQLLAEGDEKVAECNSCHTAHSILPASDARSTVHAFNVPETCNKCHGDADYMAEYGIRTNQYEVFKKSVHGKALLEDHDTGAPACNDCHGNHGALPPEVGSLSLVCGTCHVNNLQYYQESPMAGPFQDEELHACVECHGYHGVEPAFDGMVGVGDDSVCMDCHDEGDDGYEAARLIALDLDSLVVRYDSASVSKEQVARIGMDDVDIGYDLTDAHQSLVKARTLVHTFDADQVGEMTHKGIEKATAAIRMAIAEFREYRVRRTGFGLATVFITLLAVGLFLRIREIDKREQ